MKSLTIRGIDEQLEQALENHAKKENLSLNKTILTLIKKTLGLEPQKRYQIYTDLDHLQGTWNEEDAAEFEETTADFNKIDEELWQ